MEKYLNYLKRLQEIGEKTTKYADEFGEIGEREVNDLAGLKKKKEAYNEAGLGYLKCKEEIDGLNPPVEISEEHNQISHGYHLLSNGFDVLNSAVDLDSKTLDRDSFLLGLKQLQEASSVVQQATDRIVSKIQSV